MEIRNSFCVNYYKALTIRFVRELQSVLRFLVAVAETYASLMLYERDGPETFGREDSEEKCMKQ